MMGFSVSSERMQEVAESLIGIPYVHNGRDENGLDCWGLVYLFFRRIGLRLPIYDGGEKASKEWYKESPDRYYNGLITLGQEVGHYHNLQRFDIPYFTLYRDVVTHSGVMLDQTVFLHVLNGREVELATMKKRLWRRKYAGAVRLKHLTERE